MSEPAHTKYRIADDVEVVISKRVVSINQRKVQQMHIGLIVGESATSFTIGERHGGLLQRVMERAVKGLHRANSRRH